LGGPRNWVADERSPIGAAAPKAYEPLYLLGSNVLVNCTKSS